MDLLFLFIKWLVEKSGNSADGPEERHRRQDWEAWQRQQWEWQQQQMQAAGYGSAAPAAGYGTAQAMPPALPRPAASTGGPVPRRPVRRPAPPPGLPGTQPASSPGAGARPAPADATTLAQWMRPQTLRAQFVLTEVLKPPVGLRAPRF